MSFGLKTFSLGKKSEQAREGSCTEYPINHRGRDILRDKGARRLGGCTLPEMIPDPK